jgi:hypothetical protein
VVTTGAGSLDTVESVANDGVDVVLDGILTDSGLGSEFAGAGVVELGVFTEVG